MKLNVALSGFLGILLAAVFGLVLNTFDTTLRSTVAVEQATGISTISVISRATVRGRRWPLISLTPRAGWAEDCRQLRTQLLSQKPTPRSILVTSENSGEGKSFTASNLSIALALAGDSVILVDGDMRTPALHTVFDLPNRFGLSDALFTDDGSNPARLLTQTSVPNLRVVVAGEASGNPSDMLPSFKMLGLLEKLRPEADFIIFDSPSMSLVPDAGILARQADATLLVVEANRTKHPDAILAVNQLRHSGANLIGVVFNKSRNWRRGTIWRPAFLSGTFPKKPSVLVRR
ncbi:MAG TPA: CpsD/CapB family tyrosine-protein kinase [Candidatus Tectomicrobia bacterium]